MSDSDSEGKEEEKGGQHDNGSASPQEHNGSGPCSEHETEDEEENRTEDDPLSDVWESDDSQFDDNNDNKSIAEQPVKHTYEKINTKNGVKKIDTTPPDVLLTEAHANVQNFYKKKMSDECIKEAVRCLTLTIIIHHYDKPWLLAKCHADIGKMYWQLKEYALQTQEHAEKALKYLSMPLLGKEQPEKQETLETALLSTYLLGKSNLAMRKFNEAENYFMKAEKILDERKKLKKMKDKDFWTTELYTALARIKVYQKKIDDGVSYLENVKTLMEKRYGEDSPKMIALYQELAKLEQLKGSDADYDTAVEYASKAHAIAETCFDEENPLRGDAAYALAMAHSTETSEEAEIYTESYLNEAINNYELALGKSHPKSLKVQQTLAKHFASRNRPQEAITLLESSLPALIENLGEDSFQVAQVEKLLATFCLQAGESSKAKKHLKECYRIESVRYGPNASKTKATKEALDILLKNPKTKGKTESSSDKPRFNAIVKTAVFSPGYKPIPLE